MYAVDQEALCDYDIAKATAVLSEAIEDSIDDKALSKRRVTIFAKLSRMKLSYIGSSAQLCRLNCDDVAPSDRSKCTCNT